MKRPIPVAVIGCGHLGTFHARLWKGLPEADLTVVVDIVPEKARALGESLDVAWSTDLSAAIAQAEAISIATPTTTHADVAESCLRGGRAVLVEKPITATLAEGERLVRLAAESGVVLAVGHVERFNPAFRAARPGIGHPRFVESHRLSTFVPRSLDVDVVLDLMIHDLDLTLGLMPAGIESIDAVGVPVLTPGEDIANARIRFCDGAVANLTASRVSRDRVRKIRFFAEQRYVSIDLLERKVEQVSLERLDGPPERAARSPGSESEALEAFLATRRLRLVHGPLTVLEANPLEEELRDFVGAVAGSVLTGASGEDGLRSLTAALEIQRKVKESLHRLGLAEDPAGRSRSGENRPAL